MPVYKLYFFVKKDEGYDDVPMEVFKKLHLGTLICATNDFHEMVIKSDRELEYEPDFHPIMVLEPTYDEGRRPEDIIEMSLDSLHLREAPVIILETDRERVREDLKENPRVVGVVRTDANEWLGQFIAMVDRLTADRGS